MRRRQSTRIGMVFYRIHRRDKTAVDWLRCCRGAVSPDAVSMRRTEDKIRRLCETLLATHSEEEQAMVLVELQASLHEHVEHLRAHLALYPFVEERRIPNRIAV